MQTAWEKQGKPKQMDPSGRILRMLLIGGGGCGNGGGGGGTTARTVQQPAGGRTAAAGGAAGGATKLANMRQSYLLLPNGENTRLSREMQIPPGAAIVIVPRTNRLSILGLTDIVSRVLGNIATSILAIDNVVR